MRARGLKCENLNPAGTEILVAPREGAWIEIGVYADEFELRERRAP